MNEIINQNQNQIQTPQNQNELSQEKVFEWLQKYFAWAQFKDKDELNYFAMLCKEAGLNPLKGEVHIINFKERRTLVTHYKVYVERVFASGLLLGLRHEFKKTTNIYKNKEDVECIVFIKRKMQDGSIAELEYSTFYNDVKGNGELWTKEPATMHLKTTLSRALRLYFPEIVNRLPYTLEEMQSGQEIVLEQSTEQTTNELFTPKQVEDKTTNERLFKLEQAIRRIHKEELEKGNKDWKKIVIEKNKNGKNNYTDEEINFIFQIIEEETNAN